MKMARQPPRASRKHGRPRSVGPRWTVAGTTSATRSAPACWNKACRLRGGRGLAGVRGTGNNREAQGCEKADSDKVGGKRGSHTLLHDLAVAGDVRASFERVRFVRGEASGSVSGHARGGKRFILLWLQNGCASDCGVRREGHAIGATPSSGVVPANYGRTRKIVTDYSS